MDPATREYFRIRPLLTQYYLWSLEIQGDLVCLRSKEKIPTEHVCGKRRGISTFSRSARLRMLRKVATIDWRRAQQGLFISVTYQDDCIPEDPKIRNSHIDQLHGYIENYLQVKVPTLWRCEWERRKSGRLKGTFQPHFHLITMVGRFIPWQLIRQWWKRIIGNTGDCCTDIDSLKGKRKFAVYIAKYCGKRERLGSLDYVTYPKTPGRHWGILRKADLPLCPLVTIKNITPDVLEDLQMMAENSLPFYRRETDRGFCLLGKNTEFWKKPICDILLDAGLMPLYH